MASDHMLLSLDGLLENPNRLILSANSASTCRCSRLQQGEEEEEEEKTMTRIVSSLERSLTRAHVLQALAIHRSKADDTVQDMPNVSVSSSLKFYTATRVRHGTEQGRKTHFAQQKRQLEFQLELH